MTTSSLITWTALSVLALACGGSKAPSAEPAAGASAPVAGQSSVPSGSAGKLAAGSPANPPPTASAGKSGSSTTSAGATAASGTGAAGVSSAAAGSGTSAAVGGSGAAGQTAAAGSGTTGTGGDGATSSGPETGIFPPITDPWMKGPFTVAQMGGAGPSRNANLLYPRELGMGGVKHPIVIWDNGAGQTGLSIYGDLLNHIASHGFAVYACNSATDGGKEMLDGLDWMTAQATTKDSMFFDKLDVTKTAAMGHSQGSIATFAIAADPRLTTTLHLSGGTNPDIAQGHATLPNLKHAAAFLCGDTGGDGLVSGDAASEWCAYDFEHTDQPVFLVQVKGASHISAPGMMSGAVAAWLRWHLAGDVTQKVQFIGPDCTLCKRQNWMCMEKGLM